MFSELSGVIDQLEDTINNREYLILIAIIIELIGKVNRKSGGIINGKRCLAKLGKASFL